MVITVRSWSLDELLMCAYLSPVLYLSQQSTTEPIQVFPRIMTQLGMLSRRHAVQFMCELTTISIAVTFSLSGKLSVCGYCYELAQMICDSIMDTFEPINPQSCRMQFIFMLQLESVDLRWVVSEKAGP